MSPGKKIDHEVSTDGKLHVQEIFHSRILIRLNAMVATFEEIKLRTEICEVNKKCCLITILNSYSVQTILGQNVNLDEKECWFGYVKGGILLSKCRF